MAEPARHETTESNGGADRDAVVLGRHDTATSPRRWGFALPGDSETGVVLVHDLGTTPLGLEAVAETINATGSSVVVPLLPGHEDFARPGNLDGLTPPELAAAVDSAVTSLARTHENVVLAGFGLGGSLSLAVATELARRAGGTPGSVAAVALVSTPFRVHRRRRTLAWLSRVAIGSMPGPAPDSKAPDGDEVRLEAWPGDLSHLPADVERLGATAARGVTVPVIVFHAREDHLVPPSDARRLVRALGTEAKELVWLERSFHQIWLDYDAPLVAERIARFAEAVGSVDTDRLGAPTP
ncbi:MAG: alpha/beta hydrolase [Acidimicrobiia bacterium]|nr:alpha/beta hydrolase [Acidimicrobiia bacterium]